MELPLPFLTFETQTYATLADAERALRPGERIIAGRVSVHDADALLDWKACQAKIDAPAHLRGLSDDALAALSYAGTRIYWLSSGRDVELQHRVAAERVRRRLGATSPMTQDAA